MSVSRKCQIPDGHKVITATQSTERGGPQSERGHFILSLVPELEERGRAEQCPFPIFCIVSEGRKAPKTTENGRLINQAE